MRFAWPHVILLQAMWDKSDDVKVSVKNTGNQRGRSSSSSSSSSNPLFMLSGTCAFKHKGISVIIGPVGSGKSTLLMSLLGETKARRFTTPNPKL